MNGLEDLLESSLLIGESSPIGGGGGGGSNVRKQSLTASAGGGTGSVNSNNNGSIEEDWDSELVCHLCNKQYVTPRLLSCLHVFCETCLNAELTNGGFAEGNGGSRPAGGVLVCVQCSQETKVGMEGACSLPLDFVINNALDLKCIYEDRMVCTSCVTKEKAIARCKDCANFLCPNCTTAHQYMKCFDNHNVILLKDLIGANVPIPPIHKPVFCEKHNADLLSMYCYTCQEPICKTCRLTDHKLSHVVEASGDAVLKQKDALTNLVNESQGKVGQCEQLSATSDELFNELEAEHDQARGLIDETYQSYKAILEQCRDEALDELNRVHKERELKIMDSMNSVEKTIERVEQACKYTSALLSKGSDLEILTLKKHVGNQLLNLINNTPKPDCDVSFQFVTDNEKFKQAVQCTFGKVKVNSTPSAISTPHETSPFFNSGGILPHASVTPLVVSTGMSLPSSSMTSSPISMLSSFEDFSNVVVPPTSCTNSTGGGGVGGVPPGALHGFNSIQEYNLAQLASIQPLSPTPVVPVGPPAVSSSAANFTIADLLTVDMNSNAFNNIQALAKLGNTCLNDAAADLSNPRSALNGPSSNLLNGVGGGGGGGSTILPNNGTVAPLYSPTSLSSDIGSEMSPSLSMQSYQSARAKQIQTMQIRYKFGTIGSGNGQFSSPHGFCLGMDEDIVVADTNNHRIQVFDKDGAFKLQFGTPGKEEGQLWYPRKVAVLKTSGKFIVCDRGSERSRMQIFSKSGHFVKKIAIRYIDIVAGLAVTPNGLIVAVDSVSPTVFNILENGDLLSWFDCSDHMREPSDIAVSGSEYFVCDFKGHCVVVFDETGNFLRRIGFENITNFPNGIEISGAGDVLVGDSHGNRFHVAVFNRLGTLLTEFECPYVKVSRCCGLKITSEGYVVTLAKNNHHVLILNTLYIQ